MTRRRWRPTPARRCAPSIGHRGFRPTGNPHCAWTVIIDESYPEAKSIPALDIVAQTRAATWELDAIDRSDDGLADYSGPLVSDLDFGAFSHSALVRMADEVCLQMHLLYLSFAVAVRARAGSDADLAASVGTRQLIGLAGLGAERIHRALSLPGGIDGVRRVFELHPLFNPLGYVNAETSDQLHVHRSPAHDDASWISLCSPDSVQPLQAIATAVDPQYRRPDHGHRYRVDGRTVRKRNCRNRAAGGGGGQIQRRIDVPVRA